MRQAEFVTCVRESFADRRFQPIEIMAFADGVVGVFDSTRQYDIYFDVDLWQIADHGPFPIDSAFPRYLRGTGLGVLRQTHMRTCPTNFPSLFDVAKQTLRSQEGSPWYDGPRSV